MATSPLEQIQTKQFELEQLRNNPEMSKETLANLVNSRLS